MLGHWQAGVAGIPGKILAARKNDEAVRVRMRVAGRQTPVGKLLQQSLSMIALGWAALESKSGRLFRPIPEPIKNIVVRKIVPGGLSLNRYSFDVWVVPHQRPKIFGVNLSHSLQPRRHALRFAAPEPLCQAIEQVVIRVKVSLRMSARVLLAFACACQRSFEDISKIKDVVPVRQH